MKAVFSLLVSGAMLAFAGSASAVMDYTIPPASEKMYPSCVKSINDMYTGGKDKSPVRGQTKAEAYCTCLWNETPDDFKGDLAKFGETTRGAKIKTMCEKHSNWE